ncbi:hypothetical protein A5717_25930 [Mycolicibacterium porcinum]|uniref:hypothetical protein n=1 Tax=Mycolicibacterium porcinum TaxID=39693 RepID=UPI00080BA0FC|nr:hypothetical protein [Mycolicibacterium porcinum]OCB09217.1 hypothetical protein A5717_25930 [Mycolicibacterium porcinum]
MNAELQAIRDAMDMDRPGGRDREGARNLAVAYIDAHPDEFTELEAKPFEEVVEAVDVFRAVGWETEQWRCEAWLLKLFPAPQVIGGELIISAPTQQPEGGE